MAFKAESAAVSMLEIEASIELAYISPSSSRVGGSLVKGLNTGYAAFQLYCKTGLTMPLKTSMKNSSANGSVEEKVTMDSWLPVF